MGKTILEENPRLKKIIDAAEEQPSPAIALTIATVQRDAKEKHHSLVGWSPNRKCQLHGKVGHFVSVVRRPGTNVTHPNILSAPTDRIPLEILHAMINRPIVRPLRKPDQDGYTFFKPEHVSSVDESGHHPVVYAVDNILAKKMGVADALESGQFTYRAWVAALLDGYATYPLDKPSEDQNDIVEPMRMANIFVEVDEASMEQIPRQSKAYSKIQKMTPREFRSRQFYTKGGSALFLQPGGKCGENSYDPISGLCLPSTLTVLNQFEEPFGGER